MDVNLDSSRRRPRRAKQALPTARAKLRSRTRQTSQTSQTREMRETREAMRETVRATVRIAILDAAEELIATRGLHDAALAQIAKRAGVAVGTLYNYFTDRDALIRGLFESRRATFRPRLLAAINGGAELAFEPRLRRFVRELLEAFESHRSFLKLAIENEHLKPSGSTTPQDMLAGVRDIVAAGVREGVIAAGKAELLPLVITGTIKAIAVHRLQADGELVGDADAIVEILLEGIRNASQNVRSASR